MTEEVRFFRRVAIYALVVGVIYWFMSYEWIGTTLLIVFGVGGSAATLFLWRGSKSRLAVEHEQMAEAKTRDERAHVAELEAEGPFADDSGRLPASTAAPLLMGISVALLGLGLVFGPWFILVAVVPFAVGAGSWLGGVRGELAGVEIDDAEASADGAQRRPGQEAEGLGEATGDAEGATDGAAVAPTDGAAVAPLGAADGAADGTGEGVGSGVKNPPAPNSIP